jgi:hypothetical protein
MLELRDSVKYNWEEDWCIVVTFFDTQREREE